jgi:hypothetical protein
VLSTRLVAWIAVLAMGCVMPAFAGEKAQEAPGAMGSVNASGRPAAPSMAGRESLRLPGGTVEDSYLALHEPAAYAWKLFLALSRQASSGRRGEYDPSSPGIARYDADRPVVWETWAQVSGGRMGPLRNVPNTSEVFLDRGAKPVAWDRLPAVTKSVEPIAVKQLGLLMDDWADRPQPVLVRSGTLTPLEQGAPAIPVDPTLNPPGEVDEIRMNRAAYDYVRERTLYNVEGLEAAFGANRPIAFPRPAQEVKAIWKRIEEKDKPRFHWRVIDQGGVRVLCGLIDLHIMTNDLPNWFWANFVHVDHAGESGMPAAADGVPSAAQGTKWSYYRLGGTQTDFTDAMGNPTLLSGTMERGFHATSSCVGCHARATVGARTSANETRPNSLPIFLATRPKLLGAVGVPDPNWFRDAAGKRIYIQTDFVYTLQMRTLSVRDIPPIP